MFSQAHGTESYFSVNKKDLRESTTFTVLYICINLHVLYIVL